MSLSHSLADSWWTSAKTTTADLSVDTITIVFIEKQRFQFHSLSVRRQSKINVMECLHSKPASATATKNGLFWYCGCKASCNLFCPQKDRNIFERAVTSFRASGCPQPVCHVHQKFGKMRVVKDNTKGNGGRQFFVCSCRNNPCSFWQWGDLSRALSRYVVMA